ncbi:MAG: matrixin family metalloprotease [archaeon]
MANTGAWIIGILVIGAFAMAFYELPSDQSNTFGITGNTIAETILSNSAYPKWTSFPVSYYFTGGEVCGDFELRKIRRAFSIIENETNGKISFIETNYSGDINVICSKDFISADKKGYFIAGEGGYTSSGNTITSGEVDFKNMKGGKVSGSCINFPSVEIHEIMHVFALGHSEDEYSLMYPQTSSKQCIASHIDNETIDILNSIYNFR